MTNRHWIPFFMNSIAPDLHLVDFSSTTPDTLQSQVISAIDAANRFLDEMSADSKLSAEQALAEVMSFDHIKQTVIRRLSQKLCKYFHKLNSSYTNFRKGSSAQSKDAIP